MIKINLQGILQDRNMTQAELARLTQIRPSTICDLVNNNANFVKIQHIEKICKCLNCGVSELFLGVEL